jgi:hypothetical protein
MCPAEGGSQQQLTRTRLDELSAELSDDGSKMLYYEQNIHGNVRMMDLETGKVTSLTSDDQNRLWSSLSPDKRWVAYAAVCSYPVWHTVRGIQIVDTKGEHPVRNIIGEERISNIGGWSPDGTWIVFSQPPDSVGSPLKICIVSPFAGVRAKVIAETKGANTQDLYLRWIDRDTVSWFSEMKTWICGITNPKPTQLYEDSTRAISAPGGKYIVFYDYRVSRRGWWVDTSPGSVRKSRGIPRKVLDSELAVIAPDGEFLLHERRPGELHRISLPDGKTIRLPFSWPRGTWFYRITQDGKAVTYVEYESNSKLMLWENPFIKE